MAKLIWGIDPLAVSRLGRTAKSPPARCALISQQAGPLTASPSGEAFFRKLPLSPPATYAIISVSCQIHPARWEKRFVWQPAMRKE